MKIPWKFLTWSKDGISNFVSIESSGVVSVGICPNTGLQGIQLKLFITEEAFNDFSKDHELKEGSKIQADLVSLDVECDGFSKTYRLPIVIIEGEPSYRSDKLFYLYGYITSDSL